MVMFHSYISLPEGRFKDWAQIPWPNDRWHFRCFQKLSSNQDLWLWRTRPSSLSHNSLPMDNPPSRGETLIWQSFSLPSFSLRGLICSIAWFASGYPSTPRCHKPHILDFHKHYGARSCCRVWPESLLVRIGTTLCRYTRHHKDR